mgnify:CR=1 FL=1
MTSPLQRRLERKAKQSKGYHASKPLEKKMAKRVKGYRTSGSGNKFENGDVRKRGIARIEHKATQAKSFRVTVKDLEKLELAARGCDEVPIFVVDFLDARGKSTGREMAVVPLQDILDLIDDGAS